MPVNVRDFAGSIELKRPGAASLGVVALDPNGYKMDREVKVTAGAGKLTFELAPDVMYYLVH